MTRENGFVKEYYMGRKDQFDMDYALFREAERQRRRKWSLLAC